jgi:hypothetical protein
MKSTRTVGRTLMRTAFPQRENLQAALWHRAGIPVLRSGGCSWFV